MRTTEDPKPIGAYPAMRRLLELREAKVAWAAQFPALAASWDEANALDALWQDARAAFERRVRLEADSVFQLGKLGVPQRAALAVRMVDASRPAIRYVLEYAECPERPLLALLGGPGAGKTVAAAFALRAFLMANSGRLVATGAKAREGMWVASADMAVLSSFTESDRSWFERMGEAGFLVLDDFGAEAMHDHAKQRVERLIDLRYGAGRPTVLTSNCDPDTFVERAGARVVDRFREAGRIVQCGDVSLRRKS